MKIVEIEKEPLELFRLLKFEGAAASGGEAKTAIAEGHVRVNGVLETRKRRQIVAGDRIEFAGQTFCVHVK